MSGHVGHEVVLFYSKLFDRRSAPQVEVRMSVVCKTCVADDGEPSTLGSVPPQVVENVDSANALIESALRNLRRDHAYAHAEESL